MQTIEVDFDVYKKLTLLRETEDDSYNDVLREVLKLGPTSALSVPGIVESTGALLQTGDWIVKGVKFPEGTEFRADYKGQRYMGIVKKSALIVNGKPYDTPSAAAMAITGGPVNGWKFWDCHSTNPNGGNVWRNISGMRQSIKARQSS
jgi:hypothetical protein